MGPRNAYKDKLDNVVSLITCVSMNHQNQLEQMENGAMFATPRLEALHSVEVDTRRWHGRAPPRRIDTADLLPGGCETWVPLGPNRPGSRPSPTSGSGLLEDPPTC
jgi:hypothetical protein